LHEDDRCRFLAITSADVLNWTEFCSLLHALHQIGRCYPLCTITAKLVRFHNLREQITRVLAKNFRADIPARSTADAGRSIDCHMHGKILIVSIKGDDWDNDSD